MLKNHDVATLDGDFRIFWSERWQCYFLWKPNAGYYKLQVEPMLFEILKRERRQSGSFARWVKDSEFAFKTKYISLPKNVGTLEEGEGQEAIELKYEIRQTTKLTPSLDKLLDNLFD